MIQYGSVYLPSSNFVNQESRMTKDLVTINEAARKLSVSRKTIVKLLETGTLKVTMKGNVHLVSKNEASRLLRKAKVQHSRKEISRLQEEMVDQLKDTIKHLREENQELREERRLAQARADGLMMEVHRLSLPETQTEIDVPVRQGASASPLDLDEEGGIDLEGLCKDLDDRRGVVETRKRWRFWERMVP